MPLSFRYLLLPCFVIVGVSSSLVAQPGHRWKAHDPARPKPTKVTPGDAVGGAPSDAVVLFNGTSLDGWSSKDGSAPTWALRDGYMETVPGAGPIVSRQGFGDVQLHVEWATPSEAIGTGQNRGNSGVYLMSTYEVQVLDSYENVTYADGQAAAIYGQHPPLVNASRGPGAWQRYDIVFRRPRFRGPELIAPARMTILHNGVLVHDAAPVWGPTNWLQYGRYVAHADRLPLMLQDHEHPVRFRNIWVRPLPDLPNDEVGLAESHSRVAVPAGIAARWAGTYRKDGQVVATVARRGGILVLRVFERSFDLVPESASRFVLPHTAGVVEFAGGTRREPSRLKLVVAETTIEGIKSP